MALKVMWNQFHDFSDQVGILWQEDMAHLSLRACAPPAFTAKGLPQLLEYVRQQPELHVVSLVHTNDPHGHTMINRYGQSLLLQRRGRSLDDVSLN